MAKNRIKHLLRCTVLVDKGQTFDKTVHLEKRTEGSIRTPSLWMTSDKTILHARFTGNWNVGIGETVTQLSLNKWHHISYTLSDSEKRLDIYIDCLWAGYYDIQNVQSAKGSV
nr:9182_t:CDS:2 [Entrophospora candida]